MGSWAEGATGARADGATGARADGATGARADGAMGARPTGNSPGPDVRQQWASAFASAATLSCAWARRPTNLVGVLPERAVRDAPVERAPGPAPRDIDCRCYRASGELLVFVAHFRLRVDDSGRPAAKDAIPRVGHSQHPSTDEEFAR
ncbi:hypothetical protein [Streptomyces chartreusis]|uniref:hypothetical protein n=1 Tax=Streptomyces chartreusis TaxID=1969 RepID=UPI0033C04914